MASARPRTLVDALSTGQQVIAAELRPPRAELAAFPVQRFPYPINVGLGRKDQTELPDLEGYRLKSEKIPTRCVDVSEIHDGEVAAVFLVTPDTLIIIEEIAAAVQNKPAAVDLDRLRVMR